MRVKVLIQFEVLNDDIHSRPFHDLQQSLEACIGVLLESQTEIRDDDFVFQYKGIEDVEEVK
jgi:hypothetical protein